MLLALFGLGLQEMLLLLILGSGCFGFIAVMYFVIYYAVKNAKRDSDNQRPST